MGAPRAGITELLARLRSGDVDAQGPLFELVQSDLRAIAANKIWQQGAGGLMSPTALVSEVYIRIFGRKARLTWADRRHFFWAMARAMRDILVEHARRYKSLKRGGGVVAVSLDADLSADRRDFDAEDLLALSDALDRLGAESSRSAEVVHLKIFASRSIGDIAKMLGVSSSTVEREWRYARAWLREDLYGDQDDRLNPVD